MDWAKYFLERGLPVLLHQPKQISMEHLAKFIAENNTEFEALKELMKQEKDVGEILRLFYAFLAENDFDDKKYNKALMFFALREVARSESESSKH